MSAKRKPRAELSQLGPPSLRLVESILPKPKSTSTKYLNVKLTGDMLDVWNDLVELTGIKNAAELLKEALRVRYLVAVQTHRGRAVSTVLEDQPIDVQEGLGLGLRVAGVKRPNSTAQQG